MEILRPGFEELAEGADATRKAVLEKPSFLISLENLLSFLLVHKVVEGKVLTSHGL